MNQVQAAFDDEQARLRRQRQQELLARSRREGGAVDPFDWRTPGASSIPERFAELASRYPDRLALYDDSASLTYLQLDEITNRFANALLSRRGPESEVVGLMIAPSASAVIAALGTLKSGKAYVGFDQVFPDSRSAAILADAECSLIVCDSANATRARRLAGPDRDVISLETISGFASESPQVTFRPDDLAMLTYSSGTTGRPKGIVQTHYTALAHAASLAELECYGPNDRIATFGPLASGSSFLKMFGALMTGACVASYDVRRLGTVGLLDWLDGTGVTAAGNRAILRQLFETEGDRQLPQVRTITLGGDTIYRRDVEACRRLFPNALISAGLGMTEASRITEWLIDTNTPLEEEVVPVGFPAPDVRIVLLDEAGDEVATGEIGEIVVQCSYLARGYWKQPDLTAQRFRQDSRYGPETLYLTGDMGRLGSDGMLRHLGRKDYLVKIRGYLVPTAEVEGRLLSRPSVTAATVVKYAAGADGGTLVAYVVLADGQDSSADVLQADLAAQLPAYMVPQRILFMDELPLNARGKVDRSQLPPPDSLRPKLSTPYVPPSTPLEQEVVALWSELLGIDRIGINDAFLALGGDSLRAMRLVNRVNADFALDLQPTQLLAAATPAEMAALVRDHLLAAGLPD